jgi:lipid-binding SYLF domain-containing protein
MRPTLFAAFAASALAVPTLCIAQPSAAYPPRPQVLVTQSQAALSAMEHDRRLDELLHRARGVLIIPAGGGIGLAMTRNNGGWSDPAFDRVGQVDFRPGAKRAGASVVMLMMTPEAVDHLTSANNASLDVYSGLSVASPASAAATLRRADVVIWSNDESRQSAAPVGAENIAADPAEDRNYYGAHASPAQILAGPSDNPGGTLLARDMDAAAGERTAAASSRSA